MVKQKQAAEEKFEKEAYKQERNRIPLGSKSDYYLKGKAKKKKKKEKED